MYPEKFHREIAPAAAPPAEKIAGRRGRNFFRPRFFFAKKA
jgi:hypothetical protein